MRKRDSSVIPATLQDKKREPLLRKNEGQSSNTSNNILNRQTGREARELKAGKDIFNPDTTKPGILRHMEIGEEQLRNLILWQMSEELTKSGSWEYNVLTGEFVWSEGMYQLFGLKEDVIVKPEIYLTYAAPHSRSVADRLVRILKTGKTSFEEVLTVEVNSVSKVFRVKGILVRESEGRAPRFLGVDQDITTIVEVREKMRRMKAGQQLEILKAKMNTQEEERKRIAESLHNSVGQLLYGIRISLGQLGDNLASSDHADFLRSKKHTEELLSEAIKETRRISHELMPSVLEDFGLWAALEDVCSQLSDTIRFRYKFAGSRKKLEDFLEVAIYRIVQELMLNVVKHSEATSALVEIHNKQDCVYIKVEDNGRGFDTGREIKDGIGLKAIRDKLKLLNGKIKITSERGEGTKIEIRILPALK